MSMKPNVTAINPNNPMLDGMQRGGTQQFQDFFRDPSAWLQSQQGGLQNQGTNAIASILNRPSQESQALTQASPILQNIMQRSGQNVVDAAAPVHQRQLQQSRANLNASGAGRFSTAQAQAGTDLESQAANDFNLFTQQALQQGQQQQMGAAQLLGQLSGQAGQADFSRAAGAAQLGHQMHMNPIMQMFGLGTQWGGPSDLNHHVGPSTFEQIMQGIGAGANVGMAASGMDFDWSSIFGGGGGGTTAVGAPGGAGGGGDFNAILQAMLRNSQMGWSL